MLDKRLTYEFRKSVNAIQLSDDTVLVGSRDNNFVQINVGSEEISEALNMLTQGYNLETISSSCLKGDDSTREFYEIVEVLLSRGLLTVQQQNTNDVRMNRFDRQILYFGDVMNTSLEDAVEVQEKISKARVGVLGIGGVGSYVVRTLSAMGVGQIAILDYDRVEESNISRQIFYDYRDIGKKKTEVVANKIKHISPTTNVICYDTEVKSISDIACIADKSDVIVCAIDTPRPMIYDIISRVPFELHTPAIYGGSVSNNVSFGPSVKAGKSRCLKCVRGIPDRALHTESNLDFVRNIASNYTTTLIDPINVLAASAMSLEVVKMITNCSKPMFDESFIMNLNTYKISYYESLDHENGCSICGGTFLDTNV